MKTAFDVMYQFFNDKQFLRNSITFNLDLL